MKKILFISMFLSLLMLSFVIAESSNEWVRAYRDGNSSDDLNELCDTEGAILQRHTGVWGCQETNIDLGGVHLSVGSNAPAIGTLRVGGTSWLGGNIIVSGDSQLTGNVTIHGDLLIAENITSEGIICDINGCIGSGSSTTFNYDDYFNQYLNTTNSPTFDDITISDDATIGDRLGIDDSTPDFELDVESYDANTVIAINNRYGNGDPEMRLQLSGSTKAVLCVDDSVSDKTVWGTGSSCSYTTGIYQTTTDIVLQKDTTISNSHFVYSTNTFSSFDTTPSVVDGNIFTTSTSTVTLTQLDKGTEGQIVTIKGGSTSATTINDGGNFCMAGSFTIGAHDSITFVYDRDCWIETSRSNN